MNLFKNIFIYVAKKYAKKDSKKSFSKIEIQFAFKFLFFFGTLTAAFTSLQDEIYAVSGNILIKDL